MEITWGFVPHTPGCLSSPIFFFMFKNALFEQTWRAGWLNTCFYGAGYLINYRNRELDYISKIICWNESRGPKRRNVPFCECSVDITEGGKADREEEWWMNRTQLRICIRGFGVSPLLEPQLWHEHLVLDPQFSLWTSKNNNTFL